MIATRLTAVALTIGLSGAQALAGEIAGTSQTLGQGTLSAFAALSDDGAPQRIGLRLSPGALDGLPDAPNKSSRCFDLDGNGSINDSGECEGDYQTNVSLPPEITSRDDIPFEFVMANWNPVGHPPAAWSTPHFDLHFYSIPPSSVEQIRLGSCGIFIDCEDFEKAVKPVPAKYVNPDHASVKAAVGQMGNHLIDTLTPELGNPPQAFTHTWIFGAYDGELIFHEVMVTRSFLMLGSDGCTPIKQPEAWAKAGYYPTSYCFEHGTDGRLDVFLTDFVLRPAG